MWARDLVFLQEQSIPKHVVRLVQGPLPQKEGLNITKERSLRSCTPGPGSRSGALGSWAIKNIRILERGFAIRRALGARFCRPTYSGGLGRTSLALLTFSRLLVIFILCD